MKKMNLFLASLFAFSALIGFSFTVKPGEVVSYKVNTTNSNVQWKGYKVTGEHYGVINLQDGTLQFEDGMLKGGEFTINMTTIQCLDMQGEYAGKLEGHLKSADFFGVEKFPTAKFVITSAVPRGTPGDYKIVGNLTIKEKTQEIKFLANVTEAEGAVTATADVQVDRSDFDVRYGSGSFFDGLGDKTIYDEFDLKVKLVASK